MEGLNRLQVYQKAQELVKLIYKIVLPNLPVEEKYNLSSQIRRAAVSVPANIAEGFGRYYYQETIRFCYLARGSLMELSSHIDLAFEQGYISDQNKIKI
ncbi:MAG: four helix bundle protein, partial [Chloroflexota bacterium]|nr:four helix bundle protein [Chloroflexota bacterium]